MTESKSSDLSGIEGLTVYDQEAFEENVSKKLDDFVVKQKRQHDEKRLGNELKLVSANLGKAKINLNKIGETIEEAVRRGISSDRKLQNLFDQQDKSKTELEDMIRSKAEIEIWQD